MTPPRPDFSSSPNSRDPHGVNRRKFLQTAAGVAAAASLPTWASAEDGPAATNAKPTPETLIKQLYGTFNENQKKEICFAWDHMDPQRGLLRSRVSNNWQITKPTIASDFYNKDQQAMIRAIFEGFYQPEWLPVIEKQLKDDAGGYGLHQSIAIFGEPGTGKFELVMTGRHLTMRADGDSAESMAFGGPIFYGHAAQDFNEAPDHPGNVYWPQALAANKVWEILDGKQRKQALVARTPAESSVAFRGEKGTFDGLKVGEMTADQKAEVGKTLAKLLEPYRSTDQKEVQACLDKFGGLDGCSLAFYQQGDLGDDGVWDNWRLEGPGFVWHYRGAPHVHVWVNVSADPSVKLNA
ncbi:MAG TPA: DUF3500 domain-containing protein [Pirellulales bacterium]